MGAGRLGWVSRFTNTRSVIQAKSARADVREMEGSLERVRASIAEVARKLAVYVRARLERSRGRSGPDSGGPDRGWSRSGVEPLMANALDRVKAAEAKYAAMAETAEKLEATGGARHGVPGPGSSPPRSRARLPRRGARSQAGGNSRAASNAASNAGSRSLIERVTIFAPRSGPEVKQRFAADATDD